MIERLRDRQIALGESDAAFAARLGLPRSSWQAYRCGRMRPSHRLARVAQLAFPELTTDILFFLLSDASAIPTRGTRRAATRVA